MANKKCPVAKKCSGCQLSNMTYEQQLEWKQKDTEKLLGGFGKVSKIIGADDPYNYRNKVPGGIPLWTETAAQSPAYQSVVQKRHCRN